MKAKLIILLFLASLSTYAQYTLIPDVNFETKLIKLGIDTGATDGKVLTANINSIQLLDLSNSNIYDLKGIEGFTQLATLGCSSNKLTILDVSKNTKLSTLRCDSNQLISLNISNLLLLNGVICSNNELTSLDISTNPILYSVNCRNNNLISLNLKNGNNTKFSDLYEDFTNNPHLSCIQVDNETYSNSKWSAYKDATTQYSNSCGPKYTSIPNSNFEDKLISLGIDNDGKNGKVLTSNIISLTSLDVSNSSISDITGIEDFLSLTTLNVSNNALTKLNVIWQKKLKTLDCSNNLLTSLDLSKNSKLETLNFSNNQISSTNLWNNSLLTVLKVNANILSSLDIDGLKALKTLEINSNQLTALNLSENILLTQLKCNNNKITSLNISKNKDLTSIYCGNNQITNLDITANLFVTEISCENNLLTSLNLKNGKNNQFITYDFRNNPNLQCIEVDNPSYSTTNWFSKKDSAAVYNVYCGPFTAIPDINFENKLISLGIDLDGQNGKIVSAFISNINTIDLSNSSITDLTGIQYFTNLKNLNISGNQLTSIDLSNNKLLEILNCQNNQLNVLDVTKNIQLTDFYCNNNLLTIVNLKNGKNSKLVNFDFRNNPNLSCIQVDVVSYSVTNWSTKKDITTNFEFICGDYTLITDSAFETCLINKGIDIDGKNGKILTSSISELTNLDINSNYVSNLTGIQDFKKLVSLNCSNNKITSLDLSQNTVLETLNCSNNLITNVNLTNNKKLVNLNCSKNSLITLDVTQNNLLQTLECSTNTITSLDVTQNNVLTSLKCAANKLTDLNISKNTSLTILNCSENKLINLNLTSNNLLTDLNCYSNPITTLDISKNTLLTDVNCGLNKIASLDFSKNTVLKNINCAGNLLTSLNMKNGNNTIFDKLFLMSNPSLLCIQIDNEDDANARFKNIKDNGASYSENCDQYTLIPDPGFEDYLIANYVDIDGKNGKVQTFRIRERTGISISSNTISDLTGIQDFKGLQTLKCASNNLTSLDLSKNLLLKTLDCNSNAITSLDLSKNVLLTLVYCQKNKIVDLDISKNTVLKQIDCSENELLSLNIANGNYKNMNILYSKSNYSKNPNLTCIHVDNVNYANSNWFDVKDPAATYSRSCGIYADISDTNLEAKLISLGIDKDGLNGKILKSDAEKVIDLNISASSILDVSVLEFFTGLKSLNCSGNDITILDLNKNTLLTSLDCSNTKIISLDLAKNIALTSLNSSNTKLKLLTLKNSNNTKIQSINLKNNIELTCIEVDDLNYSNTNWSTYKDATANFSISCGVYTAIPDNNFEYKLIALGIDKDGKNGKVLTANISGIISLDIRESKISDITGIQDFTALQLLHFETNLVTNVDLSKNTELINLSFYRNALTSIDLTSNKKLSYLDCGDNKLTDLNVELLTSLGTIYCGRNQLTQLNLTKNTQLKGLSCDGNQLTNLNILNNTLLSGLYAKDNQIASIDLSQCTQLRQINLVNNKLSELLIPKIAPLKDLDVSNNQLTNLDVSDYKILETVECDNNKLVSLKAANNPLLNNLRCGYNELTTLEIANNPVLEVVFCAFNKLVNIDLSNNRGLKTMNCQNNSLINLDFKDVTGLTQLYGMNNQLQNLNLDFKFYDSVLHGDITNNPALGCINVKNVSSVVNWPIKKDPIAQYSIDCISTTTITDPHFEEFLILAGIDRDGKNGKVLTTFISGITNLNVSNQGITDLKGIESFVSLKKLICNGNSISTIDLSSNLYLNYLDCSNNPLTTLNVSKNTYLSELYCNGTVNILSKTKANTTSSLTVLDLSKNTLLTKLNCSNNELLDLDISKNTLLTTIDCSNNKLIGLNLNNGKNTQLLNVNFKTNPSLTCIKVDNPAYSTTNWNTAKDAGANYSASCVSLGIDESVFNKISIYPNPTKGELHISNIVLEKTTVYDSLGKLVKTVTFTSGSTDNSIDLNELPTGIYYIFLESNGAHTAKKIIIE